MKIEKVRTDHVPYHGYLRTFKVVSKLSMGKLREAVNKELGLVQAPAWHDEQIEALTRTTEPNTWYVKVNQPYTD